MQTILVANPKGGSGKTTVAIQLATWFAWQRRPVMLADLDRQQSALRWLAQRPDTFPVIRGRDGIVDRLPADAVQVVDSPAGLHGKLFDAALQAADRIVVPMQPAAFDRWASADFFTRLADEKRVRKGKVDVALLGMRVNARTQTARDFAAFVDDAALPLLGTIRDTQLYVQLQPRGLALFDLPRPRFERDYGQWQVLLNWVSRP
ncbi:ParA family protein [Jeongeupia chitinilytica]|uniref:Cobyrinic acid a,c-diamide synthase n=1 Tax=Jeongeupia chitinilytica TaxID=1041641 RepID=A0ABQ3GZ16_9NEIS|nr:ParA family protein [Jeongeupia chitinilytica]GHD62002.1 cobyrinic acid a,c-diamide synthase [Jeongeupia chitinilytica]